MGPGLVQPPIVAPVPPPLPEWAPAAPAAQEPRGAAAAAPAPAAALPAAGTALPAAAAPLATPAVVGVGLVCLRLQCFAALPAAAMPVAPPAAVGCIEALLDKSATAVLCGACCCRDAARNFCRGWQALRICLASSVLHCYSRVHLPAWAGGCWGTLDSCRGQVTSAGAATCERRSLLLLQRQSLLLHNVLHTEHLLWPCLLTDVRMACYSCMYHLLLVRRL